MLCAIYLCFMNKHGPPEHVGKLPEAWDCEHDQITYYPPWPGHPGVQLTRQDRMIDLPGMWVPIRCWQPGSGLTKQVAIDPYDLDRAAFKAYDRLSKADREGVGEAVEKHIKLQAYPKGVYVVLERTRVRLLHKVWVDAEGRVW